MKEKKINTRFKKIRKIVFRTLLVFIILFLLLGIALTLPYVQTKIAHHFTDQLNRDFKTDINVERVEINIFGGVQLKGVYVRDEKKDTLIFSNRISTSILDVNNLINGKLFFGAMTANDLVLNIKTYKGDKDTNLDKFIAAFDDGKPSSGKFRMTSDKIILKNCRFREIDYNRDVPLDVDFSKINGVATHFRIIGPNVYTDIEKISFLDHRGLFVDDAKFKFTYTKKFIRFENTDLVTKHSHFVGNVYLRYDRKDFADFNNKVIFDVITKKASISSNDIWYFYKEIGKNQRFDLKGKIGGTLNNLFIKNLRLRDSRNSEIIGDVNFKNLFPRKGQKGFYMKGSFDKLSSSYENLTTLLPNVLGKSLPTSLKKLGHFNVIGDVEVTATFINADFTLNTKLGTVVSKLAMTNINNIDNASYSGNIILDDFDLGAFTNQKDFGRTSLDVDVSGKGFIEKYLDVKFSGEAFDKSAKILGLPYPGGPLIDKYAKEGNPKAFPFTKPKVEGLNFSFSGLKTQIMYFVQKSVAADPDFITNNMNDICASIQHTIIEILMEKLKMAVTETGIKRISIGGGVSANSGIRATLKAAESEYGWKTYIPKFEYTTDNAAMIGIVGYHKFLEQQFNDAEVTSKARIAF